jgi:Cu-processing system permease protein
MRRTRPVSVIAFNTFREIIRDRILYGIVVFALLLIGVSVVLGELSFAEQARISADFGFTGIQISACVLAIFVGSTLVAREIEKQTVLTLLAKPVTRSQFILGKFLGLALVVTAIMLGLAVVLALLLIFLGFTLELSFPIALLGILMEALFLISLALFFGTFARPMMTVVFAVSFFLIGHWVDSLDFFVKKSKSPAFQILGGGLSRIIPNLERFNWRSAPVYSTTVPISEVLTALAYGCGWIIFLLAATSLIFRRRDFV